jgi:hypothetical protein
LLGYTLHYIQYRKSEASGKIVKLKRRNSEAPNPKSHSLPKRLGVKTLLIFVPIFLNASLILEN